MVPVTTRPQPLQDIEVDLEMPAGHDPLLPLSPFTRTTYRSIRRLLRSSNVRHLIFLIVVACILLATFQGTRRISFHSFWEPKELFSCSSVRSNPHSIQVPTAPDTISIVKVWSELHELFNKHKPHPEQIPQPPHLSNSDFPTKEQLKDIVKFTDTDAYFSRIQHEAVLRNLPAYPENLFKGRGIVMLAGGKYSEYAATALGMLREVGSQLPVEVWMKDRTEVKEGWCEELETEGIACRLLEDYMSMAALPRPYQWKVVTMLFSSFREILFLDADDMPVRNPDSVFEAQHYKDKGVILWPDYWKHTGTPWLPYILGVTDQASEIFQDEQSVESGQMVWDKERHWKVCHR